MEENDIYLELLKKQFCEANGLRKFNNNSKADLEAFKSFIAERKIIGEKYNEFLKYLEIDITTSNVVELYKGNVDSIVKDFDTLVLTPYSIDIDKDRIYRELSDLLGNKVLINRFITQNPSFKNDIKSLINYYNQYKYDILIGVYGKVYDKDKNKKMKELIKLSRKIDDYQYNTSILKDRYNYYFVLYTNLLETKEEFETIKKVLEKGRMIEEKNK